MLEYSSSESDIENVDSDCDSDCDSDSCSENDSYSESEKIDKLFSLSQVAFSIFEKCQKCK